MPDATGSTPLLAPLVPWGGLRARMFIALSAVSLLFLTPVVLLTLRHFEREHEAAIGGQQLLLASNLADEIDGRFRIAELMLERTAATIPPHVFSDADAAQRFLDAQPALHAVFDNALFLVGEDGRIVAESPAMAGGRGRMVSYREPFAEVVETGRPIISRPYASKHASGRPAVVVAVPVWDAAGHRLGQLHGGLELLGENFLARLARMRIGETGYVYLVAPDRTLILHPDASRMMAPGSGPGVNAAVDRGLQGFDGWMRTRTSAGVEMITGLKHLASTGWLLGANYSLAEARAPLEAPRRWYLLAMAIGTAAIALLAWLAMRRITHPLVSMTAQVEALAAPGAELRELRVDSADEVGTLAAAFNHLVRALADRERARRQSDDLVRMAFRTSPDAFTLANLATGRYVALNEGFTRITGWSVDEAVGRTVPELGLWVDPAERVRLVAQIRESGPVQHFESRFRMRDGRVIDGLVSATVVEIDGLPHLLTVTADISDIKRAERALSESEERFRLAFKSSPNAIAINRASDGSYVAVNDGFARMTGYAEEEVIGRSSIDLAIWASPADRERVVEAVARDGAAQLETRFRSKDGTILVGAMSAKVMLLDGVPHLLTVTRDVTQEREAEAERRRLDAVLARIAREWRDTFDAIESTILLVDREGRIARLNRAAQRLAGVPFDELLGKPVGEIDAGEPWSEVSRLADAVRWSGVNASGQVRDAKGRSWEVLASLGRSEVPADDRVVIVARDVSAVVQLEATLRRTEAVSAMGALVAGVAHEVRNPLFAISALVDAMEAQPNGVREPGKYLGTLRGELNRLTRLMGDLLEYGKPSALELTEREVGDLAADVVRACERRAATAGVVLTNRVPTRFAVARVDAGRIAQALANLVDNAVQHSPRGGAVTIGASRTTDAAWLEFQVCDSGPGFREEDLPQVFQPFFTRRRGGTGLGLSIVQSIAEAHAGRARVANGPGGGAVVTLRLPLQERSPDGGGPCRESSS